MALVVQAVGLFTAVAGLLGLRRARRWAQTLPPLLQPGKPDPRPALRRQVLEGEPVPPADAAATRNMARRMARQTPLLLLIDGAAVTAIASAVSEPGPLSVLAAVVLGAAAGVLSLLGSREIWRARRFLRLHPEPR